MGKAVAEQDNLVIRLLGAGRVRLRNKLTILCMECSVSGVGTGWSYGGYMKGLA